uniref:Protein kinase domain-containing protein n=1 Tax=Amphimedon queenslandica TaxID=400682 RepID=A0A1X7VCW3_AMPQE
MTSTTVDCTFTSSSEASEPSSRYYSLFKPGDRVVVQSAVKGEAFYGTARWTGPIRKAHLGDAIPVVGVEIDKKIKLDKHFPDLHMDLTEGQTLFKVPFHHTRVFLPEQLVVHAEDFEVQHQKEIITQYEVRQAAKEFNLTAEEYQYQQVILDNCKSDSKLTKGTSFDSKDSGCSLTSDKLRSLSINSPLSPGDCQLSVGSMVSIEDSNSVLYGVIQWIGSLPGCTEASMAGIELDEPLEGCSDGTWEGKRLFDCSSGHGYFTSLESVKPDIRYLLEEEEGKRDTSRNYSIGGRQYDDSPEDNNGGMSFGYHSGVFQEERRSFEETRTGYQEKDSYREQEWKEGVDYYSSSHRNPPPVSINSHKSMRHGSSMMTGGGGGREQAGGSLEMAALIPSVVQSKLKELEQQQDHYHPHHQPITWRRDERRDERGKGGHFEQLQRKVELMEEAHQSVTASLRKKESDYINLYESHEKLMEDYEEREQQYFQLKQSHESLLSKYEDIDYDYQQLKQLHQELVRKYQETSREESLDRKEFASVQASHQQLEYKVQLMEAELESKNRQLSSLKRQLNAIRNSWKIRHTDVSLTDTDLGRGGWGVVLIGEFRGQRVAVKQMHDVIQGTEYMELLHREINTMSQLRHPNLLQFIGAVLDHPSGNLMIITEVMDTSLRSAYERKELTTDPGCRPVILSIMRDVAVGLNYLHCLPDPIIHRDVSSANVLLESKGHNKWKTKISDFGSANLAQAAFTKAPGALVYGAPECFQSVVDSGRLQTTKVDVFSYGITLCEILTCRFPEHQYFQQMLQSIKEYNLSSLIEQCTQKRPQERPDMKQVIDSIDKVISFM